MKPSALLGNAFSAAKAEAYSVIGGVKFKGKNVLRPTLITAASFLAAQSRLHMCQEKDACGVAALCSLHID